MAEHSWRNEVPAMRLRYILLLVSFLTSTFLSATCVTSVDVLNQYQFPVRSPFLVEASAASTCPVRAMQVYIDGKLQFTQHNESNLLVHLIASRGKHYVTVKAWTGDGNSSRNGPFVVQVEGDSGGGWCAPQADSMVVICEPENLEYLQYVQGSLPLLAGASSSGDPVKKMRAFVDGVLIAESFDRNAAQISFVRAIGVGIHRVNVEAITESNRSFQNQANVNAGSVSPSCETPIMSSLSPASGDTSQFPVFLAAADAALFCRISAFRVYVDDRVQYTQYKQAVFTGRLTIPKGPHRVVLQAWNNQGALNKKYININVTEDPENVCMPESDPGVTICGSESLGSGYVAVFFGTSVMQQRNIVAVRLYVDDVARAQFENDAVARGIASLKMSAGRHRIVAVAWTQDGVAVTASAEVDVPKYPIP
jgi:hypothetical protein